MINASNVGGIVFRNLALKFGGAGGIRTRYLLTASQTFSRVNYGPIKTALI